MSDHQTYPGAESPDDEPTQKDPLQLELPLVAPEVTHRAMVKKEDAGRPPKISAQDKMMILYLWARSNLPATLFAPLVGKTDSTIRAWRRNFLDEGPVGLGDKPRGPKKGSRLPEHTKQAILLMKEEFPDYGDARLGAEGRPGRGPDEDDPLLPRGRGDHPGVGVDSGTCSPSGSREVVTASATRSQKVHRHPPGNG